MPAPAAQRRGGPSCPAPASRAGTAAPPAARHATRRARQLSRRPAPPRRDPTVFLQGAPAAPDAPPPPMRAAFVRWRPRTGAGRGLHTDEPPTLRTQRRLACWRIAPRRPSSPRGRTARLAPWPRRQHQESPRHGCAPWRAPSSQSSDMPGQLFLLPHAVEGQRGARSHRSGSNRRSIGPRNRPLSALRGGWTGGRAREGRRT
mmetsp:Transcript_18161/g.59413  ORF Transcript_18161/g.59413 Transcript_18161/m.59413 type:complete len:203 (-) Transcript_18161:503-1111(-)